MNNPSKAVYLIGALLALLAFSMTPLAAQNQFPPGEFYATLGGSASNWTNELVQGGGNGWRDPFTGKGPWFEYPIARTDPAVDPTEITPRWWNQWYYDGKLRLDMYKLVRIRFNATLVNPDEPGRLYVWFNWSTDLYPVNTGAPPLTDLGPNGERWIERVNAWTGDVPIGGTGTVDPYPNWWRLPVPYNPEWVSVDVRGYNVSITEGWIEHQCVPELPPGVLAMAGGLSGILLRKKERIMTALRRRSAVP